MADTNNTDSSYSALVGAITGYVGGVINASHFQAALDVAAKNGIPIAGSGINAAGNFVAAQFAFVGILAAGLTNGSNGVSNASFATAIGGISGAIYGPVVGTAIGSAYGGLLDYISDQVHEYELGGQIYDLERVLNDPQFWDIVKQNAEDLFKPLLDPLTDLGHWLGQNLPTPYDIEQLVNDFFNFARNWFPRRDPLTLDLDGDGLETVGIDQNAPILFDHDGDGVSNATGWIKPDDGFLVLDRNGNGLIDNGRELFGDSTPLASGGTAADGFAALAQEDSNGDGVVNAGDAHWSDLRVWRDLNSDGVSQEGELFTLESLDIAGIHVAKLENTTRLANGNQIADFGSYIRSDGTEGALGQITGGLADIDLADNPFYREFGDSIPLTEQARALPDMQGSGMVRDLREAANDGV